MSPDHRRSHDVVHFPPCSCQPEGLTVDHQNAEGEGGSPPLWPWSLSLPPFLPPSTVTTASTLVIQRAGGGVDLRW